jgi:hypothetical protein
MPLSQQVNSIDSWMPAAILAVVLKVRGHGLRIAAACALVAPLHGQSVRGRVFRPDSTSPAAGIVVTGIGPNGATVASALSTSSGDFMLRLPGPGRYQLRALQIGFRPTVIDGVDVTTGAVRVQNLILTGLPVTIEGVLIRDYADCDLAGPQADTFLQLWEQARGALAATRLSEESGLLDVSVVSLVGHFDAVNFNRDPPAGPLRRALHPEVDTTNAREAAVDRVFASTPTETLVASGYMRRRTDGRLVFDAPSAETLLSDDFAAHHCFSVAGSAPQHPEWVGIAFRPTGSRDTLVDIRGVLWLERASAELKRLTFEYTNLPGGSASLCDPNPEGSLGDRGARCMTVTVVDQELGLGGETDFVRLADGEWLTNRWSIRTPPDAAKWRPSGNKVRGKETCYVGPRCEDVWIMWPRIPTQTGTVSSVRRAGVEIYRNDSAVILMSIAAARRAGRHPAGVTGVVTNAEAQPLANAIVQIEDPGRVGITNRSGVFQITTLPPSRVIIAVRCRGYEPSRFPLDLLPDSTRHLKLSLVAVASVRPSIDCSNPP